MEDLWVDGHSTLNGTNDRIPLDVAANLHSSLRLIHVHRLVLRVFSLRDPTPEVLTMSPRILTIGHSNHSIDHFVHLLRSHDVAAVADVRSAPFSRYAPQFNKEALREELHQADIGYVFLGKELGARSSDRSCYVDGRVRYSRLAEPALFKSGIDRLLRGARERLIAITCTEKDPLDCHRTLLVTRALVEAGATVDHVLAGGGIETNDEAMSRLLDERGLGQPDLFRSSEEILEEALRLQELEIAYVDPELVPTATESPA